MERQQTNMPVRPVRHSCLGLMAALCLLIGSARVEAQTASGGIAVSVSGKLISAKGQDLTVETSNGAVDLKLQDNAIIRGEVPIQVSEITPGMYVGATAEKQPNGTFRMSRLHVFSEDQRGLGEGHKPLGSTPQSGATMTNANVEGVEDVAVENVKGRLLTLKYKGGKIKFVVPPDIPVVRRVVGDSSLLKPGATVSTQAARSADGSLSVSQVTVRAAPK